MSINIIVTKIFLYFIFSLVVAILIFLVLEKLLDGYPMNLQEKLKFLYKNPKNLDAEKRKLSFHYQKYFIGSLFLAISVYSFINLGSLYNVKALIFLIFFFVYGISEIFNEYFYEESKINYRYFEKYGGRYVLKVDYYKEIMKNSPITLIREGIFLLFIGLLVIFFILIIVLILLP